MKKRLVRVLSAVAASVLVFAELGSTVLAAGDAVLDESAVESTVDEDVALDEAEERYQLEIPDVESEEYDYLGASGEECETCMIDDTVVCSNQEEMATLGLSNDVVTDELGDNFKAAKKKYTIRFNINTKSLEVEGGAKKPTGKMKAVKRTVNQKLPKCTYNTDGMAWKFKGWNTKPDGRGINVKNKAKLTKTLLKQIAGNKSTIKLYAMWGFKIDIKSGKYNSVTLNDSTGVPVCKAAYYGYYGGVKYYPNHPSSSKYRVNYTIVVAYAATAYSSCKYKITTGKNGTGKTIDSGTLSFSNTYGETYGKNIYLYQYLQPGNYYVNLYAN